MAERRTPAVTVEVDVSTGSILLRPARYLGTSFRPYLTAIAGARFDASRKVHIATIDKLPGILRRLRVADLDAKIAADVEKRLAEQEATRWLDLDAAEGRLQGLETELKKQGHQLWDYQRIGVRWLTCGTSRLLADDMGLGKANPASSPTLTPRGWVPMGSLRGGDEVVGRNGKPTRVTGVFPQGVQDIYRVTLTDGATARCTLDHLWLVQTPNDRARGGKGRVLSLKEILEAGLTQKSAPQNRQWFVPMVAPVHFERRVLPVAPYVLGALLANGCLTQGSTDHSGTAEQREELRPLLEKEGVIFRETRPGNLTHRLVRADFSNPANPLTRALAELQVRVHSYDKAIPEEYLLSSVEDRLALLQGLFDNDGTVSRDGLTTEYNTTSPQLAKDVLHLARSLGASAWLSTRIPKYSYKDEVREGRLDHRIRVAMPDGFCPFRVKSKRERFVPRTKYPPAHAIADVVQEGREEAVCIKVEASDELYVTSDFVVTHNTIQTLCAVAGGAPVLVICPAVGKRVWPKEARKWRQGLLSSVLDGRDSFRWPKAGEMVVTNFDILPAVHKDECTRRVEITCPGCHPRFSRAHGPDCKATVIHCQGCLPLLPARKGTIVVVDEAHNVKNPRTRRAEAVRAIASEARKKEGKNWYLTGTPVLNNAEELWAILESCNLAHEAFGTWSEFVRLFGGKPKIIETYKDGRRSSKRAGYTWSVEPAPEAADRLQRVMLRRMKKDVMQDLPPKTKRLYPVDVDKKCLKACDELLKEHGGLAAVTAMLAKEKIPFELFSTVRSILASAKVPAMLALVEDYEAEKTPLLVFSAHRAPIDLLGDRPGWAVITGNTPAAERSEIEDAFQAGKLRGIGGTIKAAGVAITLTYGSHQVFVDQELTPSLNEQAEDRQLRHGQKNAVLITVLVANHILDERVAEILMQKQALITASVDAARDRTNQASKG